MNPAGRPKGPDLVEYLHAWDVRVPPATRRRWRRRAQRERAEEQTSPVPQSISAGSEESEDSETSPEPSRRVLAAIEQVWELEQNPGTDGSIDDWDTADRNLSKIGRAAEHAAVLLDVFARVKPVDDNQLTIVQKGLVTKALSSVLEMTQQLRVLAVMADTPLEPLPVPEDPELNVYLGCVVCYARVCDMLLMPCCHLALCEVCMPIHVVAGIGADGVQECCKEVNDRVLAGPVGEVMRCPVCRVEARVKVPSPNLDMI